MQRLMLSEQQFGRLTVLEDAGNTSQNKAQWHCICSCGNKVTVAGSSLTSERTKSCGCLRKETVQKSLEAYRRRKPTAVTRQKMKEAKQGSKHWNWKGGVTPANQRERATASYREWRTAVFDRDQYTCQRCLIKGGILIAHHIEAFNVNPELRTSVDNGSTLCEECHEDFHHQYGKGDNTREQFLVFLGG